MIKPVEIIVPKLSKELYLCSLRPALKDLLLHRIKPLKKKRKKNEEKESKEPNAKIILINDELPNISKFNVEKYFKILNKSRNYSLNYEYKFGSIVLFGEVVTSTQIFLDKQVQGRGRGENTWISPPGSVVEAMRTEPSYKEEWLALILVKFELFYKEFCENGHQIVTLETQKSENKDSWYNK
ncbi:hypothetical protein Glove_218g46 [Diversispora epigaea]|uniref:Uncharacterized protein n=1 Tax=Diversispora epigaea TaxID=1348612 RepID=A0A397IJA7_9GLOM|nr:hypothetical protein Glove_218g46 [Diversispora epigaea]